jgi:hypothetical protein
MAWGASGRLSGTSLPLYVSFRFAPTRISQPARTLRKVLRSCGDSPTLQARSRAPFRGALAMDEEQHGHIEPVNDEEGDAMWPIEVKVCTTEKAFTGLTGVDQ